ncbi:hypothetical protein [Luteibacter sp.]|uniref:hypothetical protein n=1 Tax=Luteibacter sp. TaxID=1886636 RepID=UPI0025C5A954|nr:hypothetical protein [Luteibacter sp.]
MLRLAVLGALQPLKASAGVKTIASPGVWPTPSEKLPALLVNTPTEQKSPNTTGQATFVTGSSVVIQGQVSRSTPEDALDAIEALAFAVENAVLMDYWVTRTVQRFTSVQTDVEITSEGGPHLAGFRMTLVGEMFETFDPTLIQPPESPWPPPSPPIVPLESMGVHLDMAQPFDAEGTYPNSPFPDAVQPAPRTSGPDGRDEGALDIQLPQ